jgi:ankyrin repeat protein
MAKYLQKQCIHVDDCFNLFTAVKSGDRKFVQFLLRTADMKAFNEIGWTPLHLASHNGRRDIVEVLAQYGANLSIQADNRDGDFPIHRSASIGYVELTEWFLNKGIDVMVRNKIGITILHLAAARGHLVLCRMLISRGADVNARVTFFVRMFHYT